MMSAVQCVYSERVVSLSRTDFVATVPTQRRRYARSTVYQPNKRLINLLIVSSATVLAAD